MKRVRTCISDLGVELYLVLLPDPNMIDTLKKEIKNCQIEEKLKGFPIFKDINLKYCKNDTIENICFDKIHKDVINSYCEKNGLSPMVSYRFYDIRRRIISERNLIEIVSKFNEVEFKEFRKGNAIDAALMALYNVTEIFGNKDTALIQIQKKIKILKMKAEVDDIT